MKTQYLSRGCPAASWLVTHGMSYDTDLNLDLNGDGVSLLLAYAFGLDPNQHLGGKLPVPVMEGDQLKVTFTGSSQGIRYRAETSTDLEEWTTEGVYGPFSDYYYGPDSELTAWVERDGPRRFLRLVVEVE